MRDDWFDNLTETYIKRLVNCEGGAEQPMSLKNMQTQMGTSTIIYRCKSYTPVIGRICVARLYSIQIMESYYQPVHDWHHIHMQCNYRYKTKLKVIPS